MDIVYKKIADTFNSDEVKKLFTDQGLPHPRTVDINLGQTDNPEGFEIFYPAIFVSWGENKVRIGEPLEMNLEFHVVQAPAGGTEGFCKKLAEGMAYILVLKTIQKVLTGLRAENSGVFRYYGKRPEISPYYRYHTLTYKCIIDEAVSTNLSLVDLEGYSSEMRIRQKQDDNYASEIDVM